MTAVRRPVVRQFQFHKGTIKTQAIYGNTVASNISIP